RIGAEHRSYMTNEEAIALTTTAIRDVTDGDVPGDSWEGAVLDRTLGRRKFRRLDTEELAASS
ncbi:MAG: hypothetical protein ABFS21_05575, partial [Actinomycetota bacterium]